MLKLEQYYNKTSDAYHAATLLRPSLKMDYYKLSKGRGQMSPKEVRGTMLSVMKEFTESHPTASICDSSDVPVAISTSKRKRGFLEKLDEKMHQPPCNMMIELKSYLAQGRISLKDCDILQWWSMHEKDYPVLASMARCYLAVPATSAPSERVFSQASHLITPERHSLGKDSIRACTSLKYWFNAMDTL